MRLPMLLALAVIACIAVSPPPAPAQSVGTWIDGTWNGGDWGAVTVDYGGDGTYEKTYNGSPGVLSIDNVRATGNSYEFTGTWHETSATEGHPRRTGKITVTIEGSSRDQAAVHWESTDGDTSRPSSGDSKWTR